MNSCFWPSLGVLMAQVDTSVVSLAAKPIGTDLGSTASGMQWMIDAYLDPGRVLVQHGRTATMVIGPSTANSRRWWSPRNLPISRH